MIRACRLVDAGLHQLPAGRTRTAFPDWETVEPDTIDILVIEVSRAAVLASSAAASPSIWPKIARPEIGRAAASGRCQPGPKCSLGAALERKKGIYITS
jgi:hypothetical protein